MDLWWVSWVLAATGIATMIFAGRNKWWAWCIGIFTEAIWFFYSILTNQPGFIVASLIYMCVYFRNTVAWKKNAGQSE